MEVERLLTSTVANGSSANERRRDQSTGRPTVNPKEILKRIDHERNSIHSIHSIKRGYYDLFFYPRWQRPWRQRPRDCGSRWLAPRWVDIANDSRWVSGRWDMAGNGRPGSSRSLHISCNRDSSCCCSTPARIDHNIRNQLARRFLFIHLFLYFSILSRNHYCCVMSDSN